MTEITSGTRYRIPEPREQDAVDAIDPAMPRPDFLAAIKDLLASERARIRAMHVEGVNEVTGMDVAGALTGMTDAVMRQLAERAFTRAGAPADWTDRVGVFALGSYGRGELAPYSDIDLMTVSHGRGSLPGWAADGGAELQTLLWDVGCKVGGSSRAIGELECIIGDDFVTATALLEQRPVIAGEPVVAAVDTLRERFRRKRGNAFMRYKVAELEDRRAVLGSNLFLLEPNLKTNPGCLRDIQFLRNAACIMSGDRTMHALRDLAVVEWDDVQQLLAANDHLVGIRGLLHFHHGHAHDVLHLTDQLWLADLLGYARGGRLLAVEHMMRLHYQKTLRVHQMVDLAIHRMRGLGYIGRRRILVKTRRRIDDDFVVIDGRVYLGNRDFWHQDDAPLRLMRLCRTAQRRGLRLGLELQRSIAYHAHRLHPQQTRGDHAIARCFLEILGDIGKVRPILNDMHWSGMLGAYLPEFGRLTCHMQFNSFHQYTVDEHTLIALGILDRVVTGEDPGLPGIPAILRRCERPDLLMLAVLLHDVGKFMGSGHVPRGALMVRTIAGRMGLDEIEEDLVHFLVEQHVALSDATRSRDIHDPGFLAELASDMGHPSRLDLLYALTYADAKAVGVGVFTGWQEALLSELHAACRNEIAWMTEGNAISRPQRIRNALRASAIDDAVVDRFLADVGESYAYQVGADESKRHLGLLAAAENEGVAWNHEVHGAAVMLELASRNRRGLLAEVAAAVAGNGLQVVDARTWCTRGELVLHSFRLEAEFPATLAEDRTWTRLERDLRAVVAGEADPQRFIERQRARLGQDRPADSGFDEIDVRLDQDSSHHATVIDVRVKDRIGLLYELCRIIADADADIEYASIATFGDVARDAFYVTSDGHKLPQPVALRLCTALREHLQRADDR